MKLIACFVLPIFLAVVLSTSVFALGLVIKQESIVLRDGGGACLNYELFNSKPGDITASVSVSDGLADVFDSGATPNVPGNTARDAAVPIEVCFETPADLVGCGGDDVDFTGSVIFTEGASGSGGSGSVAALSVPVPMTVRVACDPDGGSSLSLLWLIIALILLVIAILLIVRRAQQKQTMDISTMNTSMAKPVKKK